jgi:hypothetical protein
VLEALDAITPLYPHVSRNEVRFILLQGGGREVEPKGVEPSTS